MVAVNIQFNLRLPVPLHAEILARAWVESVEGRKGLYQGRNPPGGLAGRVAVEGQGIFVEAAHLFPSDTHFTRIFKVAGEA